MAQKVFVNHKSIMLNLSIFPVFQDNAIEVFMNNGHSVFLVFLNKDHVNAYKR